VLNYPFIFSNIKHELFADIIALTISYHANDRIGLKINYHLLYCTCYGF